MSLRLVTDFVNTNIPGAYPNTTVKSNPVGLGNSGIVVIMGEADGGPSYQDVALKDNFFDASELATIQSTYLSGQIVDAFSALAAPSADADITGTANRIYVVKTNQGTQASALLASSYGTLSDFNWGTPGNLYKYQILSVETETAPSYNGSVISAFGAPLNGTSFTIRLEGGAATVVTLSNTATDHNSIATLVTELNTLLPSGITAFAGTPTNSLLLTIDADVSAYGKGWGKSFELYDSTPGDLAALGLVANLYTSSQEPVIEMNIVRSDINVNQALDVSADIALQVGYQGTTATLTITSTTLSTSVSGGSGAALSIPLSQYNTISDLATFISAQTGYTAFCPSNAQQLRPSALDKVTAIGICSTGSSLMPGRVKDAAYNFATAMGTSVLEFTVGSGGTVGLPAPTAAFAYLTGGARGNTLSADIVAALAQMAGIQVNIIVPLFSQNATDDITAGVTGSGSTYTISAINAAVKNHCITYSTPKLKKHRIAVCSFNGTYANAVESAQSLGNYRISLTMQQITQVNGQGVITTFQPWYAAILAAGMQTGGFYKAIVNKAANVVSYVDPSGFDSGDPGDVEGALDAGLLFLSQDTGRAGYWVSDQTTYGFDTNFVYNSLQATYCSDLITLDLASSLFKAFGGKSVADIDAGVALAYLGLKMAGYKTLKLTAASNDAPLGYSNPNITLNAPELIVSVDIKLATAIYFIPISINLSQVQNSASGTGALPG
ncbi:Tail sheath protein subtilisin-like domain-containing protein [Azospirillaceae bacterium]